MGPSDATKPGQVASRRCRAAAGSVPTLFTRAIMAKIAASGMRVVGTPSCAISIARPWLPKLGAPSATTSCSIASGVVSTSATHACSAPRSYRMHPDIGSSIVQRAHQATKQVRMAPGTVPAHLEVALLGGLPEEERHRVAGAEGEDDLVGVDVLRCLLRDVAVYLLQARHRLAVGCISSQQRP
jgi:hypothetical protein